MRKLIFLVVLGVVYTQSAWAVEENLDEMFARKARQTSAAWGYQYLEDPDNHYIWQPETLMYQDITTGKEVWILVRQPDRQDIFSKEHGSNIWSYDGSRIGFFDYSTRDTANPSIVSNRDAMRWIVNTDGSGLKAAEGYGKYNIPFSDFGWAHTELAYYAFGSHALIDKPLHELCKMTLDSNNIVSGTVILDTSSVNTYTKEIVKDGVSTDDSHLVYRDFVTHATDSSCESMNTREIYFTALDDSPAVDSHWGISRTITGGYDHNPLTAEEKFHDVWAPGPKQNWILGDYSGASSLFVMLSKNGHCDDGGPLYEPWDGDSFGQYEEVKIVGSGGSSNLTQNPYGNPYFGHPVFDRWGRYSLMGTYTNNPSPGTKIWDALNNVFLPNYPLSTTYDGQHHSWTGWSDYVIGVDPVSMFIRANKWNKEHTSSFDVVNTHHPGLMNHNYNGYPRPSQSPDGTKVAFAAFWLNNDSDKYPYISWAVVHYPHPPEIIHAAAVNGSVTVRFDWRLNTASPRGYTTRGWPDEAASDPPAPRETKMFRLWRSPDGNTWEPRGTVEAKPFDKFDFVNGGLKTGQVSYWEVTDTPGEGTWYYAVTSVEHSGLESRTLSNVYKIIVASGAGTGLQTKAYPDDPGGIEHFYKQKPHAPHLRSVTATGTRGHYRLSWVEPGEPLIRYYNIYYSTSGTPATEPQYRIASVPAGTSSWLDWNADATAAAHYRVTSVDTQGNEGVTPITLPAPTINQLLVQ